MTLTLDLKKNYDHHDYYDDDITSACIQSFFVQVSDDVHRLSLDE